MLKAERTWRLLTLKRREGIRWNKKILGYHDIQQNSAVEGKRRSKSIKTSMPLLLVYGEDGTNMGRMSLSCQVTLTCEMFLEVEVNCNTVYLFWQPKCFFSPEKNLFSLKNYKAFLKNACIFLAFNRLIEGVLSIFMSLVMCALCTHEIWIFHIPLNIKG